MACFNTHIYSRAPGRVSIVVFVLVITLFGLRWPPEGVHFLSPASRLPRKL